MKKKSAHSDFSPDPELLTPTESRHTTCLLGGKSPSVKLMSRRENKELAKTNLKNMYKTMQELQHIGTIKDLRQKTLQSLVVNVCTSLFTPIFRPGL